MSTHLFPLILGIALLTGCAQTGSLQQANTTQEENPIRLARQWLQNATIAVNPFKETPAIPEPPETATYDIGDELSGLFADYTQAANQAMPEQWRFEVQTELLPVAGEANPLNEVQATFKLITNESQDHFFQPGGYLINSRQGGSYVTFVTGVIQEIQQRFGAHHELLILVDYLGTTDGSPFHSGARYRGELGTLQIPKEELLLNGRQPTRDFHLYAGDRLDNPKLAVLRAVSMAWHFQHAKNRDRRLMDRIQQSRYIATTYHEVGRDFRYARIVVKIKQRPLELNPSRL